MQNSETIHDYHLEPLDYRSPSYAEHSTRELSHISKGYLSSPRLELLDALPQYEGNILVPQDIFVGFNTTK